MKDRKRKRERRGADGRDNGGHKEKKEMVERERAMKRNRRGDKCEVGKSKSRKEEREK